MKILRLSDTCGSPCGGIDLWTVLNGTLPEDYLDRDGKRAYVISLRDDVFITGLPRPTDGYRQSYTKMFTLGEAKAIVAEGIVNGGTRAAHISIESPNGSDFASLYKSVYEDWLGIPHETIPVPSYRMQEPSFIRGIQNDLRDLVRFLKNRWRRAHAMTIGKTA